MHVATQFSVALVNKPGRLSAILTALNKEKTGIQAFTVMDSAARGVLRLVPDDPELARTALDKINVKYEETEVLFVEVAKESGGLPKVCRRLAEEHLNVDYAYGAVDRAAAGKSGSSAVIKINDLAKAQRVLGVATGANSTRPKPGPGRRPSYAR